MTHQTVPPPEAAGGEAAAGLGAVRSGMKAVGKTYRLKKLHNVSILGKSMLAIPKTHNKMQQIEKEI